ncbi:MAG: glycosyltransferase family 39 protein [Bacteroidetes bacterium]|nr:glycosyltransferase family 39 protein [Bacteroidota bacterium]
MKSILLKRNNLILAGFVFVKFILQYLLISPAYDLQRDEYLHLDQANHPAWGYISVPPVTSWISYIIKLLGNDVFWVKFFPALFGAMTIVVVWKTIEELKGKTFALVLAATALLLSVLLRINILYQPNSFDIFFWTLVYYFIIKYINSEKSRWLYATGIAVAFGFLSKYNIAFLILGLLPAILLTKHRTTFFNKNLYFSALITFFIILPNLLWQVENHFPTIRQLQELADTQLVHVNRFDFLKDQLLFFISSLFVILAAFIALIFYKPFRKYQLFLWSYIFTIILFIFFKAKSYYAIGLYPILIAFGAVYLEEIFKSGWKKYLRPISIVLILIQSIPIFLFAMPIQGPEQIQKSLPRYKSIGLLRWEDGKDHNMPQDFADMLGWSELAKKVDDTYRKITDKENTLVYCDNYGQAGAINYYSTFKNIHAISYNADYINWIPLDKPIKNVILIKDVYDRDPLRQKEKPLFDSTSIVGKIENPYARELGTTIYLLKGAKTNINRIIAKEVVERKNH